MFMATPLTGKQLVAAFRRWGVEVREKPGWIGHNRTGPGRPWGPVHGVLLHHTGDDAPDSADERVLWNGRSDLPGPLCNWGMTDDGVAVMIGDERANHAGRGALNVAQALSADRPVPPPGADSVDGNQLLYGQETMYSGKQKMTREAYIATVRCFAAICEAHRWSAESCIGHREWTKRKIDPGSLDMDEFRKDVAAALRAGAGRWPKQQSTPVEIPRPSQTGDASVGTEILSYNGKAYLVQGFLVRHIKDPADLAELQHKGIPARAGGAADFIGLVDIDTLERKLSDAYAAATQAQERVEVLIDRVNALEAGQNEVPQPPTIS